MDLRAQLEQALSSSYRVERELGGGGMSRVFLAEEISLSRLVVIKVLPPEMAASVNQERFRREVLLAARLQHPHIVPLLTAGAAGDLLYYVMPFIKGESLRAKLERESELPIGEAVRILREVTDALAYAHSEGVVHRDIKPDNVLIAGGHALVTDFGVAKAVSEATGSDSLTSFGMAIGTPAYMSPEQAAGDPHVDHRADLYALGAMAFEMLAGRPPFVGGNPQSLLAAHVSQMPERVSQLRPAVPAGLNSIVMRCLEKRAADRWQHAMELLPQLDLLLTPSTGGTAPTSSAWAVSTATQAALRRSHPIRVLVTFILASIGALGVAWLLVQQFGLPTWVMYSAVGLLLIGLPIIVMTGRRERQVAIARTTNATPPVASGVQQFFTWRKAITGGTLAFAGLGAFATLFMAMRLLGIGPVGTLMAKGTLKERDRIVLAEFENRTSDSTLATTVTELLRTDLAQSRSVSVYEAAQLASVLARMQLPRATHVNFDVARDVATREGLKAVLAGEVAPLGSGLVISARLVATATGEVLWAGRAQVSGPNDILGAVDHLAAALRERVGESLRTIRGDPPLEQITTSSTEALHLFAQAERAYNSGDFDGAIGLLERAIALDSTFAMAYRKIGVNLRARPVPDTAQARLFIRRAYELRDRLSARERWLAEAAYHNWDKVDTAKATAAYRAVIDQYPDDRVALNNLGVIYRLKGKNAEALALYRRSIRLGGAPAPTFNNAILIVMELEGLDSARAMIDAYAKLHPDNANIPRLLAGYYLAAEQFDSAQRLLERRREETKGSPGLQLLVLDDLMAVLGVRGHVDAAFSVSREVQRLTVQVSTNPPRPGVTADQIIEARSLADRAWIWKEWVRDTVAALAQYARANAVLPPEHRNRSSTDGLLAAVEFYAGTGQLALARDYWKKWEGVVPESTRLAPGRYPLRVRASIATAERRFDDALRDYRLSRAKDPRCRECALEGMSLAFHDAGQLDSAIVYYERYFAVKGRGVRPDGVRFTVRGWPDQFEALAGWYEAKHDSANAVRYYGKVAALWKDADAVLQPRAAAARAKVSQLSRKPL